MSRVGGARVCYLFGSLGNCVAWLGVLLASSCPWLFCWLLLLYSTGGALFSCCSFGSFVAKIGVKPERLTSLLFLVMPTDEQFGVTHVIFKVSCFQDLLDYF